MNPQVQTSFQTSFQEALQQGHLVLQSLKNYDGQVLMVLTQLVDRPVEALSLPQAVLVLQDIQINDKLRLTATFSIKFTVYEKIHAQLGLPLQNDIPFNQTLNLEDRPSVNFQQILQTAAPDKEMPLYMLQLTETLSPVKLSLNQSGQVTQVPALNKGQFLNNSPKLRTNDNMIAVDKNGNVIYRQTDVVLAKSCTHTFIQSADWISMDEFDEKRSNVKNVLDFSDM